jgi:hypothetical protein
VLELRIECDGNFVYLIVVAELPGDADHPAAPAPAKWDGERTATVQHWFVLDSSPDAYCFEPWVAATDEFTPELLDFLPLFNLQVGI